MSEMGSRLDAIRRECADINKGLKVSSKERRDRLLLARKKTKQLRRQFSTLKDLSLDEQWQCDEFIESITQRNYEYIKIFGDNAIEEFELLSALLEPPTLDDTLKVAYATRLLSHLRNVVFEFQPQLSQLVLALEEDTELLETFVNSLAAVKRADVSDVEVDDASEYVGGDGDIPAIYEFDEFLDSPEYRIIAMSLVNNLSGPFREFTSLANLLGDSWRVRYEALCVWRGAGAHSAAQNEWMDGRERTDLAVVAELNEEFKKAAQLIRNSNADFASAIKGGSVSVTEATRELATSLETTFELVTVRFPDVRRQIENNYEIVGRIERELAAPPKGQRRFWPRRR